MKPKWLLAAGAAAVGVVAAIAIVSRLQRRRKFAAQTDDEDDRLVKNVGRIKRYADHLLYSDKDTRDDTAGEIVYAASEYVMVPAWFKKDDVEYQIGQLAPEEFGAPENIAENFTMSYDDYFPLIRRYENEGFSRARQHFDEWIEYNIDDFRSIYERWQEHYTLGIDKDIETEDLLFNGPPLDTRLSGTRVKRSPYEAARSGSSPDTRSSDTRIMRSPHETPRSALGKPRPPVNFSASGPKYELTDETIEVDGYTLHRIRALRDFADVKKGELGGFIESGYNLSHAGTCWVGDNAKVYDCARVFDNAWVYGDSALVYDNAQVSGDAQVHDGALVFGNARVRDNADVCGYAEIAGNTEVEGYAYVSSGNYNSRTLDETTHPQPPPVATDIETDELLFGALSPDARSSLPRVGQSPRGKPHPPINFGTVHQPKYELTDETIEVKGRTLYRIRALRYFSDVKKGDLGGFIESEDNLSHEGNCWVFDNVQIFENARVYGDARIFENAQVYGDAQVCGNARVYDDAYIYGNARIFENARVSQSAWVYNGARVYGTAHVSGTAEVFGNAQVYDEAKVDGETAVYSNARVFDRAHVYGDTQVYDDARIFENARVSGNARVLNHAQVYGNAEICGYTHVEGYAYVSSGKHIEGTLDETTHPQPPPVATDINADELLFGARSPKYELTDETIDVSSHTLYRIRALRDFSVIEKGDLGGFVESEDNLSHKGECWVHNNAKVIGNARVFNNAKVYDKAWVYGSSRVYGNAEVYGHTYVHGSADVYGNAHVSGDAGVRDNAQVCGDAEITGSTLAIGYAYIHSGKHTVGTLDETTHPPPPPVATDIDADELLFNAGKPYPPEASFRSAQEEPRPSVNDPEISQAMCDSMIRHVERNYDGDYAGECLIEYLYEYDPEERTLEDMLEDMEPYDMVESVDLGYADIIQWIKDGDGVEYIDDALANLCGNITIYQLLNDAIGQSKKEEVDDIINELIDHLECELEDSENDEDEGDEEDLIAEQKIIVEIFTKRISEAKFDMIQPLIEEMEFGYDLIDYIDGDGRDIAKDQYDDIDGPDEFNWWLNGTLSDEYINRVMRDIYHCSPFTIESIANTARQYYIMEQIQEIAAELLDDIDQTHERVCRAMFQQLEHDELLFSSESEHYAVTHRDSSYYTKRLEPFTGHLKSKEAAWSTPGGRYSLEGKWEYPVGVNGKPKKIYVVLSYGYYPIYIYVNNRWFETANTFSVTTLQHISDSRPSYDTIKLGRDQMDYLRDTGDTRGVMKRQRQADREKKKKAEEAKRLHDAWVKERRREAGKKAAATRRRRKSERGEVDVEDLLFLSDDEFVSESEEAVLEEYQTKLDYVLDVENPEFSAMIGAFPDMVHPIIDSIISSYDYSLPSEYLEAVEMEDYLEYMDWYELTNWLRDDEAAIPIINKYLNSKKSIPYIYEITTDIDKAYEEALIEQSKEAVAKMVKYAQKEEDEIEEWFEQQMKRVELEGYVDSVVVEDEDLQFAADKHPEEFDQWRQERYEQLMSRSALNQKLDEILYDKVLYEAITTGDIESAINFAIVDYTDSNFSDAMTPVEFIARLDIVSYLEVGGADYGAIQWLHEDGDDAIEAVNIYVRDKISSGAYYRFDIEDDAYAARVEYTIEKLHTVWDELVKFIAKEQKEIDDEYYRMIADWKRGAESIEKGVLNIEDRELQFAGNIEFEIEKVYMYCGYNPDSATYSRIDGNFYDGTCYGGVEVTVTATQKISGLNPSLHPRTQITDGSPARNPELQNNLLFQAWVQMEEKMRKLGFSRDEFMDASRRSPGYEHIEDRCERWLAMQKEGEHIEDIEVVFTSSECSA